MIALYFASMGEAAGKSALCSALGISLKAEGGRVGFFKPVVVHSDKANAGTVDKDTEFIKQLLALEEPVDLLCPVSLSAKEFSATANEKDPAWLAKVKEAYPRVSQDKDMVLIEGVSGFKAGSAQALAGSLTAKALGAKAILIVRYQSDLNASQIVSAAQTLAGHLLGVVINAVPQRRMESVESTLVPSLEQSGIEVLGTLPEDRVLLTISVGELVEHLEGNILNSPQSSENLVESIMVGAMSPDPAVSYLSLKSNKAVITRGDRPDIQLAALTTSTSCLILTDDIKPLPNVLGRAKEINVPIVVVKQGTAHTMEAVEGVLDRAKFSHPKKVERLEGLLQEHLNFEPIHQGS
jgi:BioD-like phosphotransacetylase family protein